MKLNDARRAARRIALKNGHDLSKFAYYPLSITDWCYWAICRNCNSRGLIAHDLNDEWAYEGDVIRFECGTPITKERTELPTSFYSAVQAERDRLENILVCSKLQDSDAVMLELAKAKLCLDRAIRIMDHDTGKEIDNESKGRSKQAHN